MGEDIDVRGLLLQIGKMLGAPAATLSITQTVAMRRGDMLYGIAYFVPTRGQYNTADEARKNMTEDGELYRIDVCRIE